MSVVVSVSICAQATPVFQRVPCNKLFNLCVCVVLRINEFASLGEPNDATVIVNNCANTHVHKYT